MKKVAAGLLAFGMFSSIASAESSNGSVETASISKTYLGVDIYQGESNFDLSFDGFSDDEDFDVDGFRLKFGKSSPENVRYQVYFKSEETDDFFDENVYGIGLDVMKTIPVGVDRLSLFGLAGVGLDWTELNDDAGIEYEEDSLNAFHFKLGVGASYQINQSIEVITGFDWQYRSWQDIEFIGLDNNGFTTADLEIEDTSITFYAGLNFYF